MNYYKCDFCNNEYRGEITLSEGTATFCSQECMEYFRKGEEIMSEPEKKERLAVLLDSTVEKCIDKLDCVDSEDKLSNIPVEVIAEELLKIKEISDQGYLGYRYVRPKQILSCGKYPISESLLRSYLLKRRTNGLDVCVRKIGKMLYIREDLFEKWFDSHK